MAELTSLLHQHNWYMLRAIAYSRREPFDYRLTKDEAVEYVAGLLTDPRATEDTLESLPVEADEALQTLIASGGDMPAGPFLERFGPVRPYRPWREGTATAAWRHPASAAEELYFLGLVFFVSGAEGRVATVPDDLLPLFPRPRRSPTVEPGEGLWSPSDPILDLAHLLAYVQGEDVSTLAGRWLSPRALRTLNVSLARPDAAVREAQSELQTGYLRWIHYLAEAAGLVKSVGGLLKPMPRAWTWLRGTEEERWEMLWEGWQRDLDPEAGCEPLWASYRFPGAPVFVRTVLDMLSWLAPQEDALERTIALSSLARQVERRCVGLSALPQDADLLGSLPALVSGPFTWGRIVRVDADFGVSLTPEGMWLLGHGADPPEEPPTEGALVRLDQEDLVVLLPEPPHRPPLEPLVAVGLQTDDRLVRRLTRKRFVSLLASGLGLTAVMERLEALGGGALPPVAIKRLGDWEAQASALTVRRLTVLTVADPGLLEELSRQRTIRDGFLETLSPHHVAVDPGRVDRLLRFLHRSGHVPLVTPGVLSSPHDDELPLSAEGAGSREQMPGRVAGSRDGVPLDPGAAAHLWLALRTYLSLADLIRLPTLPPRALLDWLERLIDGDTLADLVLSAESVRRGLEDVIDGYTVFSASLPGVDLDLVQDVVERALAEARPLWIVYHTAGRGERTERIVEPLRLEEYGGARYLVAYCRLRQDERVFRLDRIEAARLEAET